MKMTGIHCVVCLGFITYVLLIPLQSNRPVNQIPIINNHYLSQTTEYHFNVSLLMKGIWLVGQLKQLHMFGIQNIYHCGSMMLPGIATDANREVTAIMTWIMIDNTSKASCGLNRNPALRIDKYPLCPVYGTCFQTQVRIQILHLYFMYYLARHVLTNYSIYIFLCQQIVFLMPFSSFWMLHSFHLFLKLLITHLVDFKLTTADLVPVDSNTLPLCHGRLRRCIVICIFIFKFGLKFFNSEYHCQ